MLKAFHRRQDVPYSLPPYREGDLSLLPIREHHARPLFAIVDRDRAYLRRFQNWPDHVHSLRDMRNVIATSLDKSRHHMGFDAVIHYRDVPAGKVGVVYIDTNTATGEIGYWLGQPFQGHGLMTRAAWIVTGHAIAHIGLRRVKIRCAAGNSRSRAIPERLGFRYIGVLPQKVWIHGQAHEDTAYIMTRKHFFEHMIYHIVPRDAWAALDRDTPYQPGSLHTQGYIHAATVDQVTRIADGVFAGRDDLLLLVIDPRRLGDALVYEAPDPGIPAAIGEGEFVPHIYAPLWPDQVLAVLDLPRRTAGGFTLPDALHQADPE